MQTLTAATATVLLVTPPQSTSRRWRRRGAAGQRHSIRAPVTCCRDSVTAIVSIAPPPASVGRVLVTC
ncbi:hypothetical protein E2C01_014434 [Portunus trituberculatus]|uniref:Uncharacterized protein n=1 Tax=Portunus trituberculatus TaxID=210409 RepID=A0A5B7DJ72_PORTR|nr:hypothetical protein [Portunus trituberculatus]